MAGGLGRRRIGHQPGDRPQEEGATVSEPTVRRYVRAVRRELRLDGVDVPIVAHHPPGEEAQVDFGLSDVHVAGVRTQVAVFELRLSHSGVAVHVAFGSEGQEAFLEGHVIAFARLGGVPARIRYDNARALVARVLRGRARQETERFVALRSHHGLDASATVPAGALRRAASRARSAASAGASSCRCPMWRASPTRTAAWRRRTGSTSPATSAPGGRRSERAVLEAAWTLGTVSPQPLGRGLATDARHLGRERHAHALLDDATDQQLTAEHGQPGPTMCHESPSSFRISTTRTEEQGLSSVNNVSVNHS